MLLLSRNDTHTLELLVVSRFPQSDPSIISCGRQDCSSEVPRYTPNISLVIIELVYQRHLQLSTLSQRLLNFEDSNQTILASSSNQLVPLPILGAHEISLMMDP